MQAKLRQLFPFLVGTVLALGLAPGAHAQGFMISRPVPPRPQPAQPVTIRSQKVDIQIVNGAARVEVEQVFYNPNPFQVEGTYLFSLPQGATVSNFRMTVDKEPVEGKLLTVEEARRVYEGYVRKQIDPAILEYVGRNAFQARVFPIAPTSEKHLYLIYSQAADFTDGVYQINYPLNSERVTGSTAGDLTIDAKIKSTQEIKTVYSPSHEIGVKRADDHNARATFEGKDVRANRDFQLFYTISDKTFGLNALAHRRNDEGYVMLMLAPKREVSKKDIQPKDVVFVFDTSGSMQGVKIEQARKALQTMLGALNEKDRFNVIRFASDVTQYKPDLQSASKENITDAQKFVADFRALSGTAIDDALQAGLSAFPARVAGEARTSFLIFLTDGLPTIGVTDVSKIL
jgi:Ca-activated chloride channel family protein